MIQGTVPSRISANSAANVKSWLIEYRPLLDRQGINRIDISYNDDDISVQTVEEIEFLFQNGNSIDKVKVWDGFDPSELTELIEKMTLLDQFFSPYGNGSRGVFRIFTRGLSVHGETPDPVIEHASEDAYLSWHQHPVETF